MMIKMNDNPTINKISKDVEDLAKLLSNIGYFKTEKGILYKYENNKIVQIDKGILKGLIENNVFLYGVNPARFIPILENNLRMVSSYEFNLLNNIENINILKSSIDKIETNRQMPPNDAADLSANGLIRYLISNGFFAKTDVANHIFQYDGKSIVKYDIDGLKGFLSDFDNVESLFLKSNYSTLIQKLPKVRYNDLNLWEILIENGLTIDDGISDLNELKNMMNY